MKNFTKSCLWLLLTGIMMFVTVGCVTPGKGLVEKAKIGFVDKTGQIVIEPQTSLFCMLVLEPQFHEGLCPFPTKKRREEYVLLCF